MKQLTFGIFLVLSSFLYAQPSIDSKVELQNDYKVWYQLISSHKFFHEMKLDFVLNPESFSKFSIEEAHANIESIERKLWAEWFSFVDGESTYASRMKIIMSKSDAPESLSLEEEHLLKEATDFLFLVDPTKLYKDPEWWQERLLVIFEYDSTRQPLE